MMRAALSMRVSKIQEYVETRDCLSSDWPAILGEMGIAPHPVPNIGETAISILDSIAPDLLILTGGDDIGETPQRDMTEFALLDHALEKGLPVLGVCRGLQVINAHFGGTLADVEGHASAVHDVEITTPWQPFYGNRAKVNSFHNNAITTDGLATGLVSAATDADGYVEGAILPGKPLAAVMWHPERKGGLVGDQTLLAALIDGTAPWL